MRQCNKSAINALRQGYALHRRTLLYYESAVGRTRSCIEILIRFFQDHWRVEGVRQSRTLAVVISDGSNRITNTDFQQAIASCIASGQ